MGTKKIIISANLLDGGKADGKTISDIAKKHNVPESKIAAQLSKGLKVESEHTDNKNLAYEIVMDHLMEMPDYYDKLEKMEKAD